MRFKFNIKFNKLRAFLANQDGYTALEGIVAILVVAALGLAGTFTFRKIENNKQDIRYKANIEAVYYSLEYFHTKNGYYPEKLDSNLFPWMDPESLKRGDKPAANDNDDFKYQPNNCADAKCSNYELSIKLRGGPTVTKKSKN